MLFLLNKLVRSLFVDHTKQKINKNSKGTLSLFAILYWMEAAAVITLKYTAVVSYTQYMQTALLQDCYVLLLLQKYLNKKTNSYLMAGCTGLCHCRTANNGTSKPYEKTTTLFNN